MSKEEIFNYLDERLGENTSAVISIETYIQIREETLEKIEEYCINEKEDLIAGAEVCEDILKIIEEIK